MTRHEDPHEMVDHLFRREAGRMVAVLTRLFGFRQVETAQDIVQETLLAALDAWRLGPLPDNPRAWLYRVAKNRAVDHLRRRQTWDQSVGPAVAKEPEAGSPAIDAFFLDTEIEDSQLRMLFACCHPGLPAEGQIALILRTLCGLSVAEIAAAFLTGKDVIEKRLYRVREKIRHAQINLEVPAGAELPPRLDGVLKAIYLLFSEGYHSASNNAVIRRELCHEALRLNELLAGHRLTDLPKTHALLSLLCFQASRFDARIGPEDRLILLENQDRRRWDQALIARGFAHLTRSAAGGEVSDFHLEAAIASYHAQAESVEQTNWQAIFYLYQLLWQRRPDAVIAFNRAIAAGYAHGAQAGLNALLAIDGMSGSHFYHSALGDFYGKLDQAELAENAYRRAQELASLAPEKQLIAEKIARLRGIF